MDCGRGELKAAEKALMAISAVQAGRGEAKVARVEEMDLEALGSRRKLLKVFCQHPGHVPLLREKAAKIGKPYEADIPFARRYMMDRCISPFDEVEVEYEGKFVKKVARVGEGSTALRTLAFDIETYNPRGEPDSLKDPVVMISYAGTETDSKEKKMDAGVISSKKVAGVEFVKQAQNEKQMIDEFCSLVK